MNLITTDIDECIEQKDNCTSKQRCYNNPGSFHCLCIEGYHKDEPERVCVTIQPAIPPSSPPTGQSSLAIYLAVGEYIYCMFVFSPLDSPHKSRSCAIIS